MDVARVEPSQSSQGYPQCTIQLVLTPPASGGPIFGGGGAARLEVRLIPGGGRLPGPDSIRRRGMGDEIWRGQKRDRLFSYMFDIFVRLFLINGVFLTMNFPRLVPCIQFPPPVR